MTKYRRKRMSFIRYLIVHLLAFVMFLAMGFAIQSIVIDSIGKSDPVRKYAVRLMFNGFTARIRGVLR